MDFQFHYELQIASIPREPTQDALPFFFIRVALQYSLGQIARAGPSNEPLRLVVAGLSYYELHIAS